MRELDAPPIEPESASLGLRALEGAKMAMTAHQRMEATLAKVKLPSRAIEVYGSQIVITTLSVESASAWAPILRKFAKVKAVALKSLDETAESTVFDRRYVTVYRTYATV